MDFLDTFLQIGKYYLGINITSYILVSSGIGDDYILLFKAIFYTLGLFSICVTIYFKIKNCQLERDIKKLKEKERKDKENSFHYHRDFSKKDD